MSVAGLYKQFVLIVLIILLCFPAFSQNTIPELMVTLEKALHSKEKADICFSISKAYENNLKVDSSLWYAYKIKELSLQGNYETGIGKHYLAAGGALRLQMKIKESEDNTRKAIEIFYKAKNFLYLGFAYQQLAAVYMLAEQFDLSRKNYRLAIHYSTIAGDEISSGRQNYEMGKSFHQTFEVDSSVFYLTRALVIAEKLKDKSRIFNSSGYLGSVFLTMGETEKSIRYLRYALNNQPPMASKVMVRIRLLDLAEGLLKIKEFEKADSAMKAAGKINETLKDTWGRAILNKLRGIYELQMKNYSQSLFYLRSAYHDRSALGNANGANPDIKNIVFYLGVAEYELHMYDSAIVHLRQAAGLARQFKFLRDEMYGYQLISKAFEQKGMPDSALYYLLSYDLLKDSLMIHEKEKAVIEISTKYETERKEQEIKVLQKVTEANALLLRLRNQQIEKQHLEDEKKSQQLSLVSQQNEINKLDAEQKTLSLDNEKKENEKNQAKLKLLEQGAAYQKLLASKQDQQKKITFIGIAIILSMSGYGIYRYIRRKKLQSQQELLKERLRISRELHDELGATLTGISMYSHLTREQIKSDKSDEVEKSLNKIQHSAGEMVNKLSDIVWLVNPEKDSLQQLIERIEQYAGEMSMIKGMEVKISVSPKLANFNLPVESRRSIYLFCKEAINNAVKYSNADLLEISMHESENKKIGIMISDNGKGFDSSVIKTGNGLINMKQRAVDIGGEYSLNTSPGHGTKIALNLKIT